MIEREIKIQNLIEKNKVLIIFGPRQVGKTTLVQEYLKNVTQKVIYKTGDDVPFANLMSECSLKLLQDTIPEGTLFVIDEAHKIENIGRALKLIVDNIMNVSVIVTGSSSFELVNKTGESLTGRKRTVTLYPISISESLQQIPKIDLIPKVKDYMVYGMYPEPFLAKDNQTKADKILEITNSYLLRDILEFDKVKSSKILLDLLKLISFQIGKEVSTTELSSTLGIDKNTVAKYLDLLEKSFIIYSLRGLARNLRNEVNKMQKYYFYDLGVRNAVIGNFNEFDSRNDRGELWENFVINERIKRNSYQRIPVTYYFWRTYEQKEIDFIEEKNGQLFAYEFKLNKSGAKTPNEFLASYSNSSFEVITLENLLDFTSY